MNKEKVKEFIRFMNEFQDQKGFVEKVIKKYSGDYEFLIELLGKNDSGDPVMPTDYAMDALVVLAKYHDNTEKSDGGFDYYFRDIARKLLEESCDTHVNKFVSMVISSGCAYAAKKAPSRSIFVFLASVELTNDQISDILRSGGYRYGPEDLNVSAMAFLSSRLEQFSDSDLNLLLAKALDVASGYTCEDEIRLIQEEKAWRRRKQGGG